MLTLSGSGRLAELVLIAGTRILGTRKLSYGPFMLSIAGRVKDLPDPGCPDLDFETGEDEFSRSLPARDGPNDQERLIACNDRLRQFCLRDFQ